ncbi:MAG: hypothetical protein ACLQVN_02970 [Bryobacteraceae bacterium]
MVILFCAASARAQGQLFVAEPVSRGAVSATPVEKAAPGATCWKVSLTALAAANIVDAASSWNKRELNPALAQSSGTFGWQSAALKMGITGAVVGVEWLAMRRGAHPGLYRALSVINFSGAAAIGSVAGHNFTIPASPR